MPCSIICSPRLPRASARAARGGAQIRREARADIPAEIELAKVTMVEAIAMAHGWEMQHDERVVVIGQDVGVNGGVFRATAGLQARFGEAPRAGHAARRSDDRRHVGRHGGARLEAGRGDSIHGLHLSGPRSDRESHVAHALPHARAPHLPGGHPHCRTAAAFTPPSTTPRAPRPCSATFRESASSAPHPRRAPTDCCSRPSAIPIR